jgi:hypothetical protein
MQRPECNPFLREDLRHAWELYVQQGWWWRVSDARACLEVARAIELRLPGHDLLDHTEDFLSVVLSSCLDRVLVVGVDLLHTRRTSQNFDALKRDLEPRCVYSAWVHWEPYICETLAAARESDDYKIGKDARDEWIAHLSSNALGDHRRVAELLPTVARAANLQRQVERAFKAFPGSESLGMMPIYAQCYGDEVARLIGGD